VRKDEGMNTIDVVFEAVFHNIEAKLKEKNYG
jgi:hypothetical protein